MTTDQPASIGFWNTRTGKVASLLVAALPGVCAIAAGSQLGMLLAVPWAVAVASWTIRRRGRRWSDYGWRRPQSAMRAAVVVASATVALLVFSVIAGPAVQSLTGTPVDLAAFDAVRGNLSALAIGLLIVWTVAALGEEFFFRGFVLNTIEELTPQRAGCRIRIATSLLLTSLLCGLAHAYQGPAGMILTGLLAVGFGLVYLISGRRLWASILTHGVYDTIGFFALFLGVASSQG